MIDARIARSKVIEPYTGQVNHRAEFAPTFFPLAPSGTELIQAAVMVVSRTSVSDDVKTAAGEYLAAMFRASHPVERFVKPDGSVITLDSAKKLGLVS